MNTSRWSNYILGVAAFALAFFGLFSMFTTAHAQTGGQDCQVTNAQWRAAGSLQYLQNFFQSSDAANPPYFYLDIQTQNCVGQTIDIFSHALVGPTEDEGFDVLSSLASGAVNPFVVLIDIGIEVWQSFLDAITDIGFIYIGPQIPSGSSNATQVFGVHNPQQGGGLPSVNNHTITTPNFSIAFRAGLYACYEGVGDQQQITHIDRCNIGVLILRDGVASSYFNFMSTLYGEDVRSATQLSDVTVTAQNLLSGVLAMTGWFGELYPPLVANSQFTSFYADMHNFDLWSYYCPDMPGPLDDCADNIVFQTPQIIEYGQYHPNDPSITPISAAEENGFDYTPLSQGLPGFDTGEEIGFAQFLAIIFNILLIAAGILAFVMLIIGAFQYMSIDSISGKEGGKEKMLNALLGLLLALGAWVILNTINPQLTTNLGLQIDGVVLETGGDINAPAVSASSQTLQQTLASFGAYCPGTGGSSVVAAVADSFDNHVTYRLGGKGGPPPYQYDTQPCPNGSCGSYCPVNQLCVDCSGFANIIRQCAGLPSVGASTGTIFTTANNREDIEELTNASVNGVDLVPGDLLGWLASDHPNEMGHVIVYVGDGRAIESTSGGGVGRTTPGAAFQERPVTYYGDQLKYIVRTN
jgi:cell wall-associated NlpC family hydrolase